MAPRRISSAACLASGAPHAQILPVRNADQQLAATDANHLPAGRRQSGHRDVLQNLGAKNKVKVAIRELERGRITRYTLNPGMHEGGPLQIESHNPVEALREQTREEPVPCAHIQRESATLRGQTHEVGRSESLPFRCAVPTEIHGDPYSCISRSAQAVASSLRSIFPFGLRGSGPAIGATP